jgi:O-antigen/teichoic acid export membrane protein
VSITNPIEIASPLPDDRAVCATGFAARLMSGAMWNFIATACNQGSTFAANIFVARLLGKITFGEYSMIQGTVVTISVLLQVSMGYTASKYIAEYRQADRAKASRILTLCALVSIAMAGLGAILTAVAAPWLAAHALQAPHLQTALMIASIFLLFSIVNGYQIGALIGLEGYRSLAKAGTLSGLCSVAAIAVGAWRMGLTGAVVGLAAGLIRCAVHSGWLRAEVRKNGLAFRYDELGRERQALLHFAIPAALSGYVILPIVWLANLILVRQPDGYGMLALYSAAMSVRLLVMFVPNNLNSVGFAILNNEKARGDRARTDTVLKSNMSLIVLAALGGVVFFLLFGSHVLGLFGKTFRTGQPILWVLLISVLPESLSAGFHQYIHAHAKVWLTLFGIVLPRELGFLALAALLVPQYGALGLAFAFLARILIDCVAVVTVFTWIRRHSGS